jgi:hypothetical protein
MIKIRIPNTQAYDAILWASKMFGDNEYQIENTFPDTMYEFKFTCKKQAALFVLKWL